jgi:hypothetical protein
MAITDKQKAALKKAGLILFIAFGGAVAEKYASIASQILDILFGFL